MSDQQTNTQQRKMVEGVGMGVGGLARPGWSRLARPMLVRKFKTYLRKSTLNTLIYNSFGLSTGSSFSLNVNVSPRRQNNRKPAIKHA